MTRSTVERMVRSLMSLWTTTRKTVEEATMTSNLFSSPSLSSEEIHLEPMEMSRRVAKVIFSVYQ